MNKEEAVRKTIKMWIWLIENPAKSKYQYLREVENLIPRHMPTNECYLCLAFLDEGWPICLDCPLYEVNGGDSCNSFSSPFSLWKVGTIEERVHHAQKIVEACKEWLVERGYAQERVRPTHEQIEAVYNSIAHWEWMKENPFADKDDYPPLKVDTQQVACYLCRVFRRKERGHTGLPSCLPRSNRENTIKCPLIVDENTFCCTSGQPYSNWKMEKECNIVRKKNVVEIISQMLIQMYKWLNLYDLPLSKEVYINSVFNKQGVGVYFESSNVTTIIPPKGSKVTFLHNNLRSHFVGMVDKIEIEEKE